MIDQKAGDQRGAGDAEIAPDPVGGDAHARVAPLGGDDGETDRMIDRREDADDEEPGADLQRALGEAGGDGGEADADKEDAHHAVAAPLVRQPAGRQREEAKGEEAGCGIGQERGIADIPLAAQRQGGDRGEDQHKEVVEKVADVEQQKVCAVPIHHRVSIALARARCLAKECR